jgi:hypothetical protein
MSFSNEICFFVRITLYTQFATRAWLQEHGPSSATRSRFLSLELLCINKSHKQRGCGGMVCGTWTLSSLNRGLLLDSRNILCSAGQTCRQAPLLRGQVLFFKRHSLLSTPCLEYPAWPVSSHHQMKYLSSPAQAPAVIKLASRQRFKSRAKQCLEHGSKIYLHAVSGTECPALHAVYVTPVSGLCTPAAGSWTSYCSQVSSTAMPEGALHSVQGFTVLNAQG